MGNGHILLFISVQFQPACLSQKHFGPLFHVDQPDPAASALFFAAAEFLHEIAFRCRPCIFHSAVADLAAEIHRDGDFTGREHLVYAMMNCVFQQDLKGKLRDGQITDIIRNIKVHLQAGAIPFFSISRK